jgi:hypothetical protein
LYIEDIETYCNSLSIHLHNNPITKVPVELISAKCLEIAQGHLIGEDIHGVIIDLQVESCRNAGYFENTGVILDLHNFTPSRFSGLGLLLSLQTSLRRLHKIPKIIFTAVPLDEYIEYYSRLLGKKDYAMKRLETSENNAILSDWIERNFN